MPKQERIKKPKARDSKGRYTSETKHAEVPTEVTEDAEKLKAELDELMDEIDDVLEVNAEEFVKNYVQKGGE